MKKIVLLALTAIMGFASSVSAQIFWKVEKPGDQHVSYILGTHHFANLSVLDSLKQLPAALQSIDKLYGELDMDASMSQEAQMAMMQYMMAPADSTLDKVLSPVQLDSVQQALAQLNGVEPQMVPMAQFAPLKPAVLSTQIAAAMAMKIFPELNPLQGLDKTMQDRAKELGKPVAGFETMDYQIEMLYGTPISKQAKDLMKTIADMDTENERAVALANSYLAHDIDAILKAMIEEDSDPEEYERILYTRNDNWVKQLVEEMPKESLMVVVGAGHLPGERGVLEQLRKAGYTVTPAE